MRYIIKYPIGGIAAALALMFCLVPIGSATAKDDVVTDVRITVAGDKTHFEVDVSKAVSFTVDAVANPYRVIIDVANVNFDLPPGIGHKTSGLISGFRYGIVEEGRARIVIDTLQPVLITSSKAQPAKGKKPAHLSVELLAATPEQFAKTYAKDHPAAEPFPTAEVAAVQNSAAKLQKTIVIDPGHGGIDSGASSPNKIREKDVVLATGLALRDALERTGSYKVVMTRSDDVFVALEDRVKVARDHKADLFIALHADTVGGPLLHNGNVRGATIYTVSDKASDAEAEALAAKENKSDVIAGIDLATESKEVANFLINLAQRESRNRAISFSQKIVGQLKHVTGLTGKPIRSAAFVVLKAPDVPSVLLELGYLSSKQDEALLTSPEWNSRITAAMVKAIDSFFAPSVALSQK